MKNKRFKETEFTLCCKLAKYILIAVGISYAFSVIICAPFNAETPDLAFKDAITISLMLDGFALILLTLFDMLITLIKFLSTHKIYLIKIEDRKVNTQ